MSASPGTIALSWELPHPPEKVWRALTEPALVAQWLLPSDMPTQKGQPFSFRQEPSQWWDGIVNSEVLELERPKRLSYAWKTNGATGLDTVVLWTLTPVAAGTRLELEHSGFKPNNAFAFDGAGKGWDRNVGESLRAVLAALS